MVDKDEENRIRNYNSLEDFEDFYDVHPRKTHRGKYLLNLDLGQVLENLQNV